MSPRSARRAARAGNDPPAKDRREHSRPGRGRGCSVKRRIVDEPGGPYYHVRSWEQADRVGAPPLQRPPGLWAYQEMLVEIRSGTRPNRMRDGTTPFLAHTLELTATGRVLAADMALGPCGCPCGMA